MSWWDGSILQSLKEMYHDVWLCVRMREEVEETFEATMGVRQGDPLSPLLFQLFINRLESVLSYMIPMMRALT